MKIADEQFDVGVIIGRFQVPDLHEAHRALIQHVCDNHGKVIVILGLSPLRVTFNNPLDFEARKQMILDAFPKVNVLYVKDVNSDDVWSRKVDEIVHDVLTGTQTAVLYGSRDSFIKHYSGRFPTRELEQDVFISGTEIRKSISSSSVKSTSDFRAGVVWASQAGFPKVYPTVDIAILNEDETKVLLGRKPYEDRFRFIGGFVDPFVDSSYEEAAIREVAEETNAIIDAPEYIFSTYVDDWRYRSERDRIFTTFFKAHHTEAALCPGDDISEVRWFSLDTLTSDSIVETHHVLLTALLRSLGNRNG